MAAPSAAAAAGAAAAALLQRQLAADGAAAGAQASGAGWTEHQTGDGRKFYFHEETQACTWEKPDALMTPEERVNDTKWREYKIWDGRSFYHNKETKVSCWSMPPELRKLRGESSGIDDRPLPQTLAEKRKSFWELMREKGVDETWTWQRAHEVTRGDQASFALDEHMQKQVFAEMLGFSLRQRQIQDRERDRVAASAFERLVEERFSNPIHVCTTYDEASRLLSHEPAWNLIKSDVRRDEVFQQVMERLEEKHKKARLESHPGRIARLQRLMASDPELRRARLRWKDVVAILARKDELQEDEPPLDALRVWAALRELKTAAEHEADAKANSTTAENTKIWREDRKRRDALVAMAKELAIQGSINADTPWADFETLVDGDPKFVALQDGPGATAMELFDEFQEELKRDGPEVFLGVVPGQEPPPATIAATNGAEAGDAAEEPPKKRKRTGFSEATPAEQEAARAEAKAPEVAAPAPSAEEDNTNPLDALIAGGLPVQETPAPAPAAPAAEEEEEEDPLMQAVAKGAAEKQRKAAEAAAEAEDPLMEAVENAAVEKERREAAAAAAAAAIMGGKSTPSTLAGPSATDLTAKKVDELKAMCRDKGLAVSGRKQDLVDRLMAAK